MVEPDKQLTFTEEDFREACFDAFMEGRVHANWEIQGGAPIFHEYFDQLYSGDKQVWCPSIAKIRNQFNTEGEG